MVQCLCPSELVTAELQDLLQRACDEVCRLTATDQIAGVIPRPVTFRRADAVSFLVQRQVHLLDMHSSPMDEQGRPQPDAVGLERVMNERALQGVNVTAPPVRLAVIGCTVFPIQYRQEWQSADSSVLRAAVGSRTTTRESWICRSY